MLQILILNRPFLKRGLTMAQRVCYAGINLFWLFPLSRLTFIFSPLLYIFFSLEIYQANMMEFASYALTYLVSSFAMQSYLYGKVRWPWVSELYEYVQSVMLLGSILSVVRNPRKPTFNVTAKGQTLDRSMLSPIARPYFLIFGLLLAAAVYSAWRFFTEPLASDLLMIVAGWNLINLGLAGAALGVVSERRELRRNHRLSVRRHALMRIGAECHSILVLDASSGGMTVEFLEGMPKLPQEGPLVATMELRRGGKVLAFEVEHRNARETQEGVIHGFAYRERTPETFMAIADLMYSDKTMLQERLSRRQVKLGFFAGTIRFAVWTLRETLRGLAYLARLVREQKVVSVADAPMTVLVANRTRQAEPAEFGAELSGAHVYG